ncbi:DUF6529 family protein [Kitasatospora sp. DSM 101779]|uniref:DUF6529 family protein n=1 Tax=Kitasatospora sp. DSM 101779 TaxID=2853165 RepID=UPI0021DA4E10|nr:DUF6529 family protein [Kitasatospora sp. DSM 101779]MCU7826528.1 hypothetical protein [Kitasatospora sp. DSM 101779]
MRPPVPQDPPRRRPWQALLWLAPVAVSLGLYWYGRAHTPDYTSSFFGQQGDDATRLKAQLGSVLFGLALVQLLLALWMYRRLPGAPRPAPRPVPTVHRLVGLAAFLLSLPIAQHCLVTYGVQLSDSRVALHSITGCVLYGAFVAKVIVVRNRRLPGWALPLAGGVLVCAIGVLWYTAALWYLNGYGAPGL